LIGSLISGILSEFTKPGIKYSADAVQLIGNFIIKNISKIEATPLKCIFAIKLIFALSSKSNQNRDSELAFKILQALIQGKWLSKKNEPLK
jgi:hypothetical protein